MSSDKTAQTRKGRGGRDRKRGDKGANKGRNIKKGFLAAFSCEVRGKTRFEKRDLNKGMMPFPGRPRLESRNIRRARKRKKERR